MLDAQLFFWPCLFTCLAVLVGGLVLFARHCASGPPSPRGCCSRARARRFALHVAEWLECTSNFDGLLAECLEIEELRPDGTVLASFAPKGLLLSDTGAVHEGAIALLTDTVTSWGQIAAGHLVGLSLELGVTFHAPVPVGERLVASARVLKVYPGAMISLEMELRRAATPDGEEGQLLASGWQTKSMKAPYTTRLWHGIAVRCLPLYSRDLRRFMALTRAWTASLGQERRRDPGSKAIVSLAELRARYWANFSPQEIEEWWRDSCEPVEAPLAPKANMDALLALRREEGISGGEGVTILVADISPRLQNIYGISHGGATASLLAATTKEHAKAMRQPPVVPVIKSFSVHYKEPVPGGVPVGLVVKQQPPPRLARPEDRGTIRLSAELYWQDRPRASANFTVLLPEPPRPPLEHAPLLPRRRNPYFGMHRLLQQRLPCPGGGGRAAHREVPSSSSSEEEEEEQEEGEEEKKEEVEEREEKEEQEKQQKEPDEDPDEEGEHAGNQEVAATPDIHGSRRAEREHERQRRMRENEARRRRRVPHSAAAPPEMEAEAEVEAGKEDAHQESGAALHAGGGKQAEAEPTVQQRGSEPSAAAPASLPSTEASPGLEEGQGEEEEDAWLRAWREGRPPPPE